MSKKFFLSFLLFFVVTIPLVFIISDMVTSKKVVKKERVIEKRVKTYRYRKYAHVKSFYKDITEGAIKIAIKYNIPPAALLAIAGVESGYGRGYVARITGNILSLGAKNNEAELPALNLPNLKKDSSVVVYGDLIGKYGEDELEWKLRAKSLKKDYRPMNFAGTNRQLDYFDRNLKQKRKANLECIEDFAKVWISRSKKFKPFVDAREMLDKQVKLNSKNILFDRDLNIKFIYMISGKENSFNYRKTWAPKVVKIMDNVGLIDLTRAIYLEDKIFDEVW